MPTCLNRLGSEMTETHYTNWADTAKTVPCLIAALQSFENQELEVRLSVDGGQNHRPITMIGNHKMGQSCVLTFFLKCWLSETSPETGLPREGRPPKVGWIDRGKKISQLIKELHILEDQDRFPVEISVDDDNHCYPISRIEQRSGFCEVQRLGDFSPSINQTAPECEFCLLMFCPD